MKTKYLLMITLASLSWFAFGWHQGQIHTLRHVDTTSEDILNDIDTYLLDVVFETIDTVKWDKNYPADYYINSLIEYGKQTKSHRR